MIKIDYITTRSESNIWVAFRNAVFVGWSPAATHHWGWIVDVDNCLSTETVQGATLSLESVDDVHGGDRLPLGVFGVGNSVTDNVLEEHL